MYTFVDVGGKYVAHVHVPEQLLPAKSISECNYFPLKAFPQVITAKAFPQAITSCNRIGYREVALMKTVGNVRKFLVGYNILQKVF